MTVILSVALVAMSACATKLAPGGPYTDLVLYNATQVINTAYDSMHSFVQFEYDNRALLAPHPEVKAVADNIRQHGHDWLKAAIALRETYVTITARVNSAQAAYDAIPSEANAQALADAKASLASTSGKLDAAVAVIQTVLTQATNILLAYQPELTKTTSVQPTLTVK
ncbi:MAG TPA: hypothetical protein VMQ76_05585 [Terracidiphilus sp.]|nr:hypothetical protein [Terracidiphilus sp.]